MSSTTSPAALFLSKQAEAKRWIEAVQQEKLPKGALADALLDGSVLCNVMLHLDQESVPKIEMKATGRLAMQNITFFLEAAREYGVPRSCLFAPEDLYERRDLVRVIDAIHVLADIACTHFAVEPTINQVREQIAAEYRCGWSEEQMREASAYLATIKRNALPDIAASDACDFPPADAAAAAAADAAAGHGGAASSAAAAAAAQAVQQPRRPLTEAERNVVRVQAVVRGWLARQQRTALMRRNAYRVCVVEEIYETEKTYVNNLTTLLKVYVTPLRLLDREGRGMISTADLRLIFSDVEVILNINKRLLEGLESRWCAWSPSQKLGDIFLEVASFLKVYTQYVKNFNDSLTALNRAKKNDKFATFMEQCKVIPMCNGLSLAAFLIMPVQRIPRYALLLAELVRQTDEQHPDYANLTAALRRIQEIADYVNRKKAEAENITRVLTVQDQMVGKFDNLAIPSRRFVRESALTVASDKKVKDRYCFLFNDVLIITKFHKRLLNAKPVYQYKQAVPLQGYDVRAVSDTLNGSRNAFELFNIRSNATFVRLACESADDRDAWVADLHALCQELAEQRLVRESQAQRVSENKADFTKKRLEQQYSFGRTRPNLTRRHSSLSAASTGSTSGDRRVSSASADTRKDTDMLSVLDSDAGERRTSADWHKSPELGARTSSTTTLGVSYHQAQALVAAASAATTGDGGDHTVPALDLRSSSSGTSLGTSSRHASGDNMSPITQRTSGSGLRSPSQSSGSSCMSGGVASAGTNDNSVLRKSLRRHSSNARQLNGLVADHSVLSSRPPTSSAKTSPRSANSGASSSASRLATSKLPPAPSPPAAPASPRTRGNKSSSWVRRRTSNASPKPART